MEDQKSERKYSLVGKIAVFVVALIITVAIIVQGNFLEGLLKLLGVGASQTERISITSIDDFRGVAGDFWADLEGELNRPVFDDTAAFSFFTYQPSDPGLTAGFVMPLVAGGRDPLRPIADTSSYTSPIVDVGFEAIGNILQTIEVLDYQPGTSEIIYKYRSSDSLDLLKSQSFRVLDMHAIDTKEEFIQKQSVMGVTLPQYLQFEVGFVNTSFNDRPMVAEINIVHGPEDVVVLERPVVVDSDPTEFDGDFNGDGKVDSLDFAIFLTKFQSDTIDREE